VGTPYEFHFPTADCYAAGGAVIASIRIPPVRGRPDDRRIVAAAVAGCPDP
jgi:hypothetical protein